MSNSSKRKLIINDDDLSIDIIDNSTKKLQSNVVAKGSSGKLDASGINKLSKQLGLSALPTSPFFSRSSVAKIRTKENSSEQRWKLNQLAKSNVRKRKPISDSSIAVAKKIPSLESAAWFSDDILGNDSSAKAFQLTSDGEYESDHSSAKAFQLTSDGEYESDHDRRCTRSSTLFSLDVDAVAERIHSDVSVTAGCNVGRKAIPVNIDNLFSTNSSDAEDNVPASITLSRMHVSPPIPSMFLDIVDLRKNSCCGYSYIIRLVDPSDR